MFSTFRRHVIDINATASANLSIVPGLLAAHALTGCDIVASYYGIGKGKALKVLKMGKLSLSLIGDTRIPIEQYGKVIDEASKFLLACYNLSGATNLTAARKMAWRTKIAKSISEPPIDECTIQAYTYLAHCIPEQEQDLEPTVAVQWKSVADTQVVSAVC